MKKRYGLRLRHIISVIALVGITACSGSSDDGGGLIIGTGKTIEGTATSNKLFASNSVEVRAKSGERAVASFNDQGRFTAADLTGTGPWLLRSDLGNGNYLYGVATESSGEIVVQNIHSYSDAVVRSWYETQNMQVDSVFEAEGTNLSMPSAAEANAIYNTLFAVVTDVVDNYGLSGVNLNTAEFVANGAGVDGFILQNPVIQNDGSITITILDPDNNTASVAVEGLDLTTDLTVADTTDPSIPADLRALPSATDEITLVWSVSSDNIGIARYAIFRDAVQIATSPYPVFVDGGLSSGVQYNYSVVAIDAAGNESGASAIATAAPQGSMDTTPPQTPASVQIDTRRGSLDLSWSQVGISDVVSYSIHRGTTPTNLSSYVNVNSTFLFDEAVNAGVQYCYEISAVDASGNTSPATGLVCATAPGDVVASGGTTTPIDNTPTDGLTAPQVDVTNTPCTAELGLISINTDTVVPAGCYIATSGITINEPGNLTLEPGVIIKFRSNNFIDVNQGASLTAEGTPDNPIVLTGTEPTPGHWIGVDINSSSVRNKLDHVQIEYAGGASNDRAALTFLVPLNRSARLAMSNSTIRFNTGPGMAMSEFMSLSTFDGNRYTGNTVPVVAEPTRLNLLDKRSLYTGNTLDAILVAGDNLTEDLVIPELPVPYHVQNPLFTNETLSVEPGVTLKFAENAKLAVSPDATLSLVGTAEKPINLVGVEAESGAWDGVEVTFSDDSEMRFVNIQHAGGDNGGAALSIRSATSNVSRLTMDNVSITDSAGLGLIADISTEFPEFSNVTISGNAGIAEVDAYAAQQFNDAVNIIGNTVDAIVIKNQTLNSGDVVLANALVPYHVDRLTVNSNLTLEAGVSFLMEEDGDVQIQSSGSFTTNGTLSDPVSIVGRERVPGYWEGLNYLNSNSDKNQLTHTLLADGGGSASFAANAHFTCNVASSFKIVSSRIENSAGHGLFNQSNTCVIDVDEETTFTNNVSGDIN